MADLNDAVTGVIVDPAALGKVVAPLPLTAPSGPKDSVVVTKSPETVEAERVARAAEVSASELRTESQRRVNMIWEYTQAMIAISVVVACIAAAFWLDPARAEILRNAFFLIVGFYFGRTNHQTQGGIGPKQPLHQSGR